MMRGRFFRQGDWQGAGIHFGQGQGVVTQNDRGRRLLDRDKGLRQAFVLMLTGNLRQPLIELRSPAIEALAVMAAS
jgi:hypothetical protein